MTIGRAAEISLKDARKKAEKHLEGIRLDGIDPLEVREAARQEARQAPIVQDGLDYYFDEYAPAKIKDGLLKESTVDDYKQQARKYLEPSLGKLKIADVQRSDVEKALPSVTEDPKTGRLKNAVIRNRVLTFISSLFSLFGEKGWRAQNSNPTSGISQSRENPRDRVLSADELAALAKALKQYEQQYPVSVAAIRVAALTGLRIGEILNIRWEDVDFSTGRLVLPETKTGDGLPTSPNPRWTS